MTSEATLRVLAAPSPDAGTPPQTGLSCLRIRRLEFESLRARSSEAFTGFAGRGLFASLIAREAIAGTRVEWGMRIGVVFPQTELGGDPAVVRAYAQRVEELGFTHILAYDHVVGADPNVHRGWQGPYDIDSTFHEPFVMFGYLAAVTSLELVTGVIILPQRQSVLVAKQAAEVDLLTGGRFRLGIGLGWNAVEYEALGEKFTNRGKRSEEQVEVMRKLWTERSVTFNGKYHTVTGGGPGPAADPAADPGVVRCGLRPRLRTRRTARRRLVPDDGPRTRPRPRAGTGAARGGGRGPRRR